MEKKIICASLVVLGICALVWGILVNTDWYERHFGTNFSDRMNIRVVLNGKHMAPSAYTLMYTVYFDDDGFSPANKTETGYSIDSGYGTYRISVGLDEREIEFFIENIKNWWRTNIVLDVANRNDGIIHVVETLDVINDENRPVETYEWILS